MIKETEEPLLLAHGISCEEAFRRIVLPFTAEIDAQLALFFGSDDPSGPHKARVALRRLTTALDAFAPILKKPVASDFRREAKEIFRLLGQQRDADVYLAGLTDTRKLRKVQAETDATRTALRVELRKRRAVGFAPRLRQVIETAQMFRTTPKGQARRTLPVETYANRALDEAWETCLDHGKDIARMNGRDQHEFRKDMKSLRYLAEFFAPLWPGPGQAAFHDQMQDLQDALGHLNDLRNARARGRKLSSEAERQAQATLDSAQADWSALREVPCWWPVEKDAES